MNYKELLQRNLKNLLSSPQPGQPENVFSPDPSSAEGVIIISTYEEMQIILTIALLVVAILNIGFSGWCKNNHSRVTVGWEMDETAGTCKQKLIKLLSPIRQEM